VHIKSPNITNMTKVKTLDDLKKLRQDLQDKLKIREKGLDTENQIQIKVAMATCGIASGAKGVMDFFIDELDKRNIDAVITQTGCMGYCYAEPTVEITLPGKEPVVFGFVDIRKADEIIEKYIKSGELIDGIIPVNYETIDKK
jgi:NADP-reducing hydrogenase subunit HndB